MAHAPFARGVSHLMYVGDDAGTAPTSAFDKITTNEKIAGALGLWAAISGRGLLRLAGIATAGYVGYKATK